MGAKKKTKNTAYGERLHKNYYDVNKEGSYGGIRPIERKNTDISHKKVTSWLEKERPYTLHKPVRYNFHRRRVIVGGLHEQWQADLVDLSKFAKENDNYRYLITVIDVFSKYAYVRPLLNKKGNTIKHVFAKIFKEGRTPRSIQCDKGGEFINGTFQSFLKEQGISLFTSQNEDIKACIVERFNRTLQQKMYRVFTARHSHKYIDVLPNIVATYNVSYHRSIGMPPREVTHDNSEVVWHRLYSPREKDWSTPSEVLDKNDHVRISKARKTFHKGYLPQWSEEIFRVDHLCKTNPITYVIKDVRGRIIEGAFYKEEIQRVQPPKLYDIEAILDKRTRGRKTEYLIKWLGYDPSFNSWESDIVKLV